MLIWYADRCVNNYTVHCAARGAACCAACCDDQHTIAVPIVRLKRYADPEVLLAVHVLVSVLVSVLIHCCTAVLITVLIHYDVFTLRVRPIAAGIWTALFREDALHARMFRGSPGVLQQVPLKMRAVCDLRASSQ